jgi:hypothetical protein
MNQEHEKPKDKKRSFVHCDTMDRPVVMDVKVAIEIADVKVTIKRVKKEYEPMFDWLFKNIRSKKSRRYCKNTGLHVFL